MGTLRRASGRGESVFLCDDHLVGRSPRCDLEIARPSVSSRHAVLRWVGDGWTVRDLDSRNGTFVNGRALRAAETVRVRAGDVLIFGEEEESWELVSDSPPTAALVPIDGEDYTPIPLTESQLVSLPSHDKPLVSVFQQGGRWRAEGADGTVQELDDGSRVTVSELRYQVHIPRMASLTMSAERHPFERRLANAEFNFRVAPDEETAEATVRIGPETHELKRSAHLYLLAYLARERAQQVADCEGNDEVAQVGWVDVGTACSQLVLASRETLTVQVHRCRRELEKIGLADPGAIIDRGRRGLLRIGVEPERFEVRRA